MSGQFSDPSMLDALKCLLASATPNTPTPSQGVPEVQAAAAALHLELAHADGELSAEEQAHVWAALGRHFALDEAAVTALLA